MIATAGSPPNLVGYTKIAIESLLGDRLRRALAISFKRFPNSLASVIGNRGVGRFVDDVQYMDRRLTDLSKH